MKKILAQRGEGAKEELGHSERGIDECPTLTPAIDRRNDSKVVAPHPKTLRLCGFARGPLIAPCRMATIHCRFDCEFND
jgi:hypothetical protein